MERENARRGNKKTSFIIAAIILAFLFLQGLPACSKTEEPTQKVGTKSPVKKQKEKKVAKKVSTTEAKELEVASEFTYDPAGKPDPFEPLISEIFTTKSPGTKRRVPLTPLQKYDLNELKLVAVIRGAKEPVAMVEDSTGHGYFLKKGMSIGKSDGVIREIKNGSVVVEEKTYDVSGDLQTKLVTLGLHKSETED
jgi:type IV pilus assembly protein PilP